MMSPSNEELQTTINSAAKRAMTRHIDLFHRTEIPESFIQSSCALDLQRRHQRLVLCECLSDFVKTHFHDCFEPIAALGDDISAKFRIDMMILDPSTHDAPPTLRAIVEFKANPNPTKVAYDLARTKKLLVALASASDPKGTARFGYQLICWTESANLIEVSARNMTEKAHEAGGVVLAREIFDVAGFRRRCGIVAIAIS